jgi:outer membrane protein assembly factor BamB
MRCLFALAPLALLGAALAVPAGDNWPQFRGPGGRGVSDEKGLPDTWSPTKNVAWKLDLKGRGWSSPVVWGDRLFLTSCVRKGKDEKPGKGLYFGGERPKPPKDEHTWLVTCIDVNKGKVLWEKAAHSGLPSHGSHIKNSYASETPATDGKRVYVLFGNIGLFCYDLDGKLLWTWKQKPHKMQAEWGTAASPVVYKDRVYVVHDNEEDSYLVAINAETGKEVWRVKRDEKSNWATPFVWKNDKRTEIVTAGTKQVRSYDLDGKELWHLKGMSKITIPTPFAAHGLLFVSSGYVMDTNRPLYAIKPGAKGDITLGKDETSNQWIAWRQKQAAPYNPSTLVYGDHLYVLYDMRYLACFDARTGKQLYRERLAGGAGYTASPWAYDGKVFLLNEDGETAVIEAGSTFKVLHKNNLDEMTLATPAIANGRLYMRTMTKLYCIRK